MSPHANDSIRAAVGARQSSGGPEWADGELYVVDLDFGTNLDTSEPMPLSAARRRLVEIIDSDWPQTPQRDSVLGELRDGPTSLFSDGKAYALNADETVWGGIRPADST